MFFLIWDSLLIVFTHCSNRTPSRPLGFYEMPNFDARHRMLLVTFLQQSH